jgi:hypothetical protein
MDMEEYRYLDEEAMGRENIPLHVMYQWEGLSVLETIEEYFRREYIENQIAAGMDPRAFYSPEDLADQRATRDKGEFQRSIERSNCLDEDYLGYRRNYDRDKKDCARTYEEREAATKLNVPKYPGGSLEDPFLVKWIIPEYNDQGWVTETPYQPTLMDGAGVLSVTKIYGQKGKPQIEIKVIIGGKVYVRYTCGRTKSTPPSIWINCKVQGSTLQHLSYDEDYTTSLDIADVCVIRVARHHVGYKETRRNFVEFSVAAGDDELVILVSTNIKGKLYGNIIPKMGADQENPEGVTQEEPSAA